MSQRPDYIYSGGNVLMHSPLQLKNSDMYGFFVKGDRAKLQHSVDITLNAAAAGRARFDVLSPFVMLTFTRVNHASSTVAEDQAKGWGKETDIVTWIMVGQMEDGKLSRIFSYPFHIWVDDCMALINGRELYGYPKYECQYTMPAEGGDPTQFTLAAKGFQPFAPATELAMHPLLEVTATQQAQAHRKLGNNFFEVLKEVWTLARSEPDFLHLDKAGWEDVLSLLLKPHVDQIFLKQFPDSSGTKAVYQAIVAAPATVNAIKSVQLLGHQYQCNLHAFDSFPLNETLGWQLGAQPVLLPFHVQFDFTVGSGEELVDNSQIAPKKIAVLGGGVGAMTAAFYLTDQPGWQNRYDITVYQMGWRLGGKGASGRNAAYGQRIEEHGLHIWFGFYDNAFALMQKAYQLLQRPPGAPLATWEDAFKPQHFIALTEYINDQWKIWPIDTPIKPGVPGHHNEEITLGQIAATLYAWIKQLLGELRANHLAATPARNESALERLENAVGGVVHAVARIATAAVRGLHELITELPELAHNAEQRHHISIASLLRGIKRGIEAELSHRLDEDDGLRRLYICIDLGITNFAGMIEDGVLTHGFDVINDQEYRAWLTKHGANQQYTVPSAPVRGLYDLVFAFADGDYKKPDIEAGTMLRGILRIALCYHGGMMWKMQAGMGDTVFTPLYQALKARGVKFEFFHRVDELIPAGNQVAEIRLTRQADLAKDVAEYNPLVPVKGLDCWPSEPNYQYLDAAQAELMQANNINLESHWSNWPQIYEMRFGKPLQRVSLKLGQDFDHVVFGISLGSIRLLCPKLLAQDAKFNTMTEKVKTVVTQAYQVWMSKDVQQLGWRDWPKDGQEPVLTSFTEPYDTWAPMDQLLVREDWPPAFEPKSVSYFCSAMPITEMPPPTDYGFPARCAQLAKAGALNQLKQQVYNLWPQAGARGSFQWSWLIDPTRASGERRFDSQFWRANIDPSERYVLSVTNSTKYRLSANGTAFSNLFLAGDWLKTGLNAGCVEAAVMGGMQASRAMSGYPARIKGESDT